MDPPSPFVRYLHSLQGFPTTGMPWPTPRTEVRLYQLAGYGYGYATNTWAPGSPPAKPEKLNGWPAAYHRWQAYARAYPPLREWLESDMSWEPPDTWPREVAQAMPSHVTPLAWAIGCFPDYQHARLHSRLCRATSDPTIRLGVAAMSAHASGWVVRPADIPRMRMAAEWLQTQVPFVLWATPVRLDSVGLGDCPAPYFEALAARTRLVGDPLAAPAKTYRDGLPPDLQEIDELLSLPRAHFDPFRSTRNPYIAAATYAYGNERRWDWVNFDTPRA